MCNKLYTIISVAFSKKRHSFVNSFPLNFVKHIFNLKFYVITRPLIQTRLLIQTPLCWESFLR